MKLVDYDLLHGWILDVLSNFPFLEYKVHLVVYACLVFPHNHQRVVCVCVWGGGALEIQVTRKKVHPGYIPEKETVTFTKLEKWENISPGDSLSV